MIAKFLTHELPSQQHRAGQQCFKWKAVGNVGYILKSEKLNLRLREHYYFTVYLNKLFF